MSSGLLDLGNPVYYFPTIGVTDECHHTLLFLRCWGPELRSLWLHSKHFIQWAIPPRLLFFLFAHVSSLSTCILLPIPMTLTAKFFPPICHLPVMLTVSSKPSQNIVLHFSNIICDFCLKILSRLFHWLLYQ